MSVSYDVFTQSFLDKVSEYDFLSLNEQDRTDTVDRYMKKACSQFNKVCVYNLNSANDGERVFNENIPDDEIDEISDIVSEGMLVQWMKPYVYRQENYENMLNTTDYSGYSPAELLHRITSAYDTCKRDFVKMVKEYSYNHGDLSNLHI